MTNEQGNLAINSENIFPIIKKWLYSDHDIFIREVISNASDAITKLKKLEKASEKASAASLTGADIADRLIAYGGDLPIQPIHPIQAILQNPEVAALIDDLGLEIKSITYIKPQENESID